MTTPTEPGMLPCPMCQGRGDLERRQGRKGIAAPSAWLRERVVCRGCGLSTKDFKRPGLAKTAWNTRSPVPGEGFSSLRSSTCAPGSGADGWVLVPKEPTDEMLEAGWVAHRDSAMPAPFNQLADGFRAMVLAAPKHPDALGIGSVRNRAKGEREAPQDLLLLAVEALEACRGQFISYQDQHLAKTPPDTRKALTNHAFALICDTAISKINEAKS